MRFISSLAIISLAGFGLARHPPKCQNETPCMSSADVQELANAWARMFTAWQDSDAKYLANDYAARARGLNRAQGRPFDGISVDKAQFIRTASSRVRNAYRFYYYPGYPTITYSTRVGHTNAVIYVGSGSSGDCDGRVASLVRQVRTDLGCILQVLSPTYPMYLQDRHLVRQRRVPLADQVHGDRMRLAHILGQLWRLVVSAAAAAAAAKKMTSNGYSSYLLHKLRRAYRGAVDGCCFCMWYEGFGGCGSVSSRTSIMLRLYQVTFPNIDGLVT